MKTVLRRVVFAILTALFLLSGASCGAMGSRQAWRPPRPVAMMGEITMGLNLMPSWMTWWTTASEGDIAGGLLIRDGDIVGAGSSWLVYTQGDGASLEMSEEDGRLILSGKTISITPADNEGCWEWLARASSDDLRSLRFLELPEDLDERRLSALKRLAAVNPHLSLAIGSIPNSKSAAALFKPRMLILGGSVPAAELNGILAGQKQIESLFIFVKDAENLDFLVTLPNLRRLSLFGWDPARTGPLPKGMRALKSLLISDSEMPDASALAAVPEGIEELSLVGSAGEDGKITSLNGLERFSNLRTLILNGSGEIGDLSVLRGMKKLAWVGLPPGITQEQFSAFIGEHPAMKIVELIGCKGITDLSPLQRLTGLTGLVVGLYSGKFDAVDQLKSLEFLGLPSEVFGNDPDEIARIREALPRALVVPVCLGSGWILLVMPLAALMWITASRVRRQRYTPCQYGILSGRGKQP